jgi:hypothetical protein
VIAQVTVEALPPYQALLSDLRGGVGEVEVSPGS